MKIKTSELTGPALDWAVAKCENVPVRFSVPHEQLLVVGYPYMVWQPHANGAQGWPIIDREGILLRPIRRPGHPLHGKCLAMYDGTNTGTMVQWVKRESWHRHYFEGPTTLIAAMRCYVASRLGDEVDVPEELVP